MALAAGTKLGPYEIVAPAGVSGMGEVYRARDTRLERDVAIKVVSQHFSSDPELRARFEREARSISSLQHPHICTLFDVGQQEGVDFLVMEYLEGATLADRLKKGPLKTDELLKAAIEIADALDTAHRQAIVHRDLKPGNVMLTKGGAKLMDFGLAKPIGVSAAAGSGAPPTFTAATAARDTALSPLTHAGGVVGTYQYMSPEQVEGLAADARSDIFSFGALLYEMATGRRAFDGKSQLSVASAILEQDPEPVGRLQPMTPPALENLIATCLAKDPNERIQTAHDVKLQLRWIAQTGSQAGAPRIVTARRRTQRLTWAALSLGWIAAAAAVGYALLGIRAAESSARLVRAQLAAPHLVEYASAVTGAAVLSPDATRMVFLGDERGRPSRLWVLDIASGTSAPLAGTDGAIFPFWSPDGRYLGFFAEGKLKKILSAGGPVQVLADAGDGRGGTWSADGTIVYTPDISDPLYKVREGGGKPEPVTQLPSEKRDRTHRNPYFLPDGKRFLFTDRDPTKAEGMLYAASTDGMPPTLVLDRASNVQYASGHLFFLRDGNLVGQRFDLDTLQFLGDPVALAEDVDYWNARDLGNFSVAGNTLVYKSASYRNVQLAWGQRGTKAVQPFGDIGRFSGLRVSPTGRLASVNRFETGGASDVWLVNLERQAASRLTFDGSVANSHAFSPDGERIAIAQIGAAGRRVILRSATGAPGTETVLEGSEWTVMEDWSRDGKYLIVSQQRAETGLDLFYLELGGKQELVPLVGGPQGQSQGRLSPNGRWLAYSSNESGRGEVYVVDFPAARRKIQVTSRGAWSPEWSVDGRTLYYGAEDGIASIEVSDPENMQLGGACELVEVSDLDDWEWLPGEKRAVLLRRVTDDAPRPMHILVNWLQAVQK